MRWCLSFVVLVIMLFCGCFACWRFAGCIIVFGCVVRCFGGLVLLVMRCSSFVFGLGFCWFGVCVAIVDCLGWCMRCWLGCFRVILYNCWLLLLMGFGCLGFCWFCLVLVMVIWFDVL